MKISVFGLGYVGSVTAACLAELGHQVIGVDIHGPKVKAMQEGRPPVQEPGLDELLARHLASGRLHVTMDSAYAVKSTTCSLVAVGTPSLDNGAVDLRAVERCVESIAITLAEQSEKHAHALVIRSTVPPGTTRRLLELAAELSGRVLGDSLVGGMNPEFLREGVAVKDFFAPCVIVLGADDEASRVVLDDIYVDLEGERVVLPTRAAELVKYTNNAFHALKIAFANEIGRCAEALDLDGQKVMEVLCKDTKLNISTKYLRPGFAYGGSCLPKDLRGLNHLGRSRGVEIPLIQAIGRSNREHIQAAVKKVRALEPKRVAILGFSFKEGTDDVRESPALYLVRALLEAGMEVCMYDQNVEHHHLLGANRQYIEDIVPDWQTLLVDSMDDLAAADVVVVTTAEPAHASFVARVRETVTVLDLSQALMNEVSFSA